MKKQSVYRLIALAIFCSALILGLVVTTCAQASKVRPAFNAGGFYPADAQALTKMVDDFLARAAVEPLSEPPVALISPHAGYEYSGQVAAHCYVNVKLYFDDLSFFSRSHVCSLCFPFSYQQ